MACINFSMVSEGADPASLKSPSLQTTCRKPCRITSGQMSSSWSVIASWSINYATIEYKLCNGLGRGDCESEDSTLQNRR